MNPRKLAEEAVKKSRCAKFPVGSIGCGKSINIETEFKDVESEREYMISGLCQDCQNKMFG